MTQGKLLAAARAVPVPTPEVFAGVEPVYHRMIVRRPAFAAPGDAAPAPPPTPARERPAAERR